MAALKAKVDALKPQISMSLYSLRQALTRVKTAAREVNVDSQVCTRLYIVIIFLFDGPTKIQFVANIDSVANIGIRYFFLLREQTSQVLSRFHHCVF